MKAQVRSAGRVAGRRVHLLSVACTASLAVFLAGIAAVLAADLSYVDRDAFRAALSSEPVRAAIALSAKTSAATLALVLIVAVPTGYALSRFRFPGRTIADAVVDLPIVLPPVVIGVSLLVFFQTAPGRWVEGTLLRFVYTVPGIVLCQFAVSASYAIRSAKAAFDSSDPALEELALTLGSTRTQAFFRVALPLARSGVLAGAILAWTRAVGLFAPLMVFTGAVRGRTEVMPTTVYLELSVGRIDMALAVAFVLLALAGAALVAIRLLAARLSSWEA
ncbi:MAG: ABC transporter permease [Planctomycetota bacterium]